MYVKLIIVGVLVITLGVLGRSLFGTRSPFAVAHADVEGITLLPKTLGSSRILNSWHNQRAGTIEETGALYAAGAFGPAPIILDYRRGSPRAHNGIGCFLTQGDTLVFEHLRRMRTASGMVVFDVGALRAGDKLRVMAAAACTPTGCRGERLSSSRPLSEQLSRQLSLKNLLDNPYANGVVPVAIILEHKIGSQGEDATIADLEAELERVMLRLDLAPARRLAAAQAD